MRIGVTGSTGLIGSALVGHFEDRGHQVHRFIRPGTEADAPDVTWDPTTGALSGPVEGIDAVVHLAGESIAGGRWTPARKTAIATSRIQGTRKLSESLAKLDKRPHTLVAASAIGYYGNRGDDRLTESSGPGDTFLSTVAKSWEEAASPAVDASIRVVNLRIGMVISADGGALAEMLTPFRLGVGGPLGSGDQWMSWIALEDLVGVVSYVLDDRTISGPVNAVAPNPVTNRTFARTLGRVIHRPAILPLPSFAIEVLFGEMGRELLLASTRVIPEKLARAGYEYRHPHVEGALEAELSGR